MIKRFFIWIGLLINGILKWVVTKLWSHEIDYIKTNLALFYDYKENHSKIGGILYSHEISSTDKCRLIASIYGWTPPEPIPSIKPFSRMQSYSLLKKRELSGKEKDMADGSYIGTERAIVQDQLKVLALDVKENPNKFKHLSDEYKKELMDKYLPK